MQKYIDRINNIDWDKDEFNEDRVNGELAYEYIRRLAVFSHEIRFVHPWAPYIVRGLNSDEKYKVPYDYYYNLYCSNCGEYAEFYIKYISSYLQLAEYSLEHPEAAKYLDIFEPLIRLFERRARMRISYNEIEIYGYGLFPLRGYIELFLDAVPKDISNIH